MALWSEASLAKNLEHVVSQTENQVEFLKIQSNFSRIFLHVDYYVK